MRAAVEEAAKYGARVTAHAHGAEGIKNAVRAGVQSIEHGSLMDDEAIRLMKEKGIFLVADIYNGDYIASEGRRQGWPEEFLRKNDETTEAQRQGFRKAVAAGVKIAYGTDSGRLPARRQRPAAPLHGPLRHDADAGHPGGHPRARPATSAGRIASGPSPPASTPISSPWKATPSPTSRASSQVAFVMKGGAVVKGP